MAEERLDLRKETFNKAQYIKTINTSFDELGNTTITEDLIVQPTVEEFFGLYNSLFYDIQALGETNSHQYLVQTSGEYINFDDISAEVQALQAEIAQLREDLLKAQMDLISTQVAQSRNEESNTIMAAATKEIQDANSQLVNTNTTLSENTQTSTGGNSTGTSGNY
jgi:paraquat-inducible protein B